MKTSTKFHAYWASSLRDMKFSLRMTESENQQFGIGLQHNNKIQLALKLVMKNLLKMSSISLDKEVSLEEENSDKDPNKLQSDYKQQQIIEISCQKNSNAVFQKQQLRSVET